MRDQRLKSPEGALSSHLRIDRPTRDRAARRVALVWRRTSSHHSKDRNRMQGPGMVASDGFAEFLREQLAPLGQVTMRRMFGKTGVFCGGVMLGMVTDNMLYLRVDDHNRAAFKEAESAP